MSALKDSLLQIFVRDISRLEDEIKLYPDEASIWRLDGSIKNTAGNLCLHLCGNLQHYIGHNLGGAPYVRNRDNEFAAKNIARETLLAEIAQTKASVQKALASLDDSTLEKEYPENVFGHPITTTFFMVHLAAHLSYHLGQINYHRRLLATA